MTRTRFNRAAQADAQWHDAIRHGDAEAAARLLRDGADIHAPDAAGQAALHLAAAAGDLALLRLLCAHSCNGLDRPGPDGTTMGLAAARGDTGALRLLADHGATLDASDHEGQTPLMRAWRAGQDEAMRWLLRMGADARCADPEGRNILHLAAAADDAAALDLLLAEGGVTAMHALTPTKELTPLHAAVKAGAHNAARVLIAAGADVHTPDAAETTPLHSAAMRGDARMIRLLVREGQADIDRAEKDTAHTPLQVAVIHQQEEALRALCDLGADPHRADTQGRTPLNIAGWNGFTAGVRYLMEEVPAETDAARAAQSRLHALYDALFYEHAETACYLIASGKVDMNLPTRGGRYILQAALEGDMPGIVEKIVAAGARADVRDAQGASPLLLCAARNRVAAAAALLEGGANPDLPGVSAAPLHTAIERGFGEMVALLLAKGADTLCPNSAGQAALDLARQTRRGDIVRMIETAAAQQAPRTAGKSAGRRGRGGPAGP